MFFNTPFDRVREPGEVNSGQIIVESAGYVPAKIQIENMMYAGQNLSDYRKDMFGGDTDEEALENADPTLEPNFDLADASRMFNQLESKRTKSQPSTSTGDVGTDKVSEDTKSEVKAE